MKPLQAILRRNASNSAELGADMGNLRFFMPERVCDATVGRLYASIGKAALFKDRASGALVSGDSQKERKKKQNMIMICDSLCILVNV